VRFALGDLDAPELRAAVGPGADAVFASRVLHHAPRPSAVIAQLGCLCAPGGSLVVLDYVKHDDESLREQADTWLGFEPAALRRFARSAGLTDVHVNPIPAPFRGDGPDKHLPWQALFARNPSGGARRHHRRQQQSRNDHG